MVINYNRTAAYMCPGCGEITYGDFSLFELSGGRGITIKCDCQKSHLDIYPKSSDTYVVALRCILCDEVHKYAVPLNDLLKKRILDFTCPNVLIGLVFIGKQDEIKTAVADNAEYIREVVSACGLGHTGNNGITMLKALDKIQELSEESSLFCECGSNLIDVDVLEDEIILECCMCGGHISFTADEIRNGQFSDITEITIEKNTKE